MRLYRYFVELIVLVRKDRSVIPVMFCVEEKAVRIDQFIGMDRGYSRQGEYCERYHCICQGKPVTLFKNRARRYFIELAMEREDLMDPLDRQKYRTSKGQR